MRIYKTAILIIITLLMTRIWSSCTSQMHQISKEKFGYLSSENNLSYKIRTQDQSEYEFQRYALQNDTLIIYPKHYLFFNPDTIRIPLEQIEYASATPVSTRAFTWGSFLIPILFFLFLGTYIALGEAFSGL